MMFNSRYCSKTELTNAQSVLGQAITTATDPLDGRIETLEEAQGKVTVERAVVP